MGDGTHKLPVKADLRLAIGKNVGDTVNVLLEERLVTTPHKRHSLLLGDTAWERKQADPTILTMNGHADKSSPPIELDTALREHSSILANLLELDAHDFS